MEFDGSARPDLKAKSKGDNVWNMGRRMWGELGAEGEGD
jgi:hypothetical protein